MLGFESVLPDVYLLRTPFDGIWSGVYLFAGEENILLDTGASDRVADEVIVPALKELSLTPGDICWLINTHCHGDHMGGNARLLALSGRTKTAVHKCAADQAMDPLRFAAATRTTYPADSPPPPERLDGHIQDRLLAEGETLAGRLVALHTPGHAADCVSFLDRRNNALFTGDAVQCFGMSGKSGASGLAFYQALADYRRSLEKLHHLGASCLMASHDFIPYGFCAYGAREVRRYLEACDHALDIYDTLVRRALADGMQTPDLIAKRIMDAMGTQYPDRLFMAMFTVDEHIKEIRFANDAFGA